jgi:hypothetical protein
LIQELALKFAKDLGVDQFKGLQNGWLQSFLKRHNIVFRTMSGESGDVNVTIVSEWKSKLPNLHRKCIYFIKIFIHIQSNLSIVVTWGRMTK